MSTGWLFAMGVVVTVLVVVGLALPIYGAVLDGRDQAARKTAPARQLSNEQAGRRSAA
jgi:hypothetical protein